MTRPQITLDHRITQTQTLTPRLQQAVRLLQLSALDYEHELQTLMAKNPFLEPDEAAAARQRASGEVVSLDAPDAAPGPAPESPAATASPDAAESADTGAHELLGDGGESWVQSPGLSRDGGRDSSTSAAELMVARDDLREHLRGQATLLPLTPRDRCLVFTVIESLDDDGYLRIDLAELARLSDLDPAVDICEINTALRLVQSFDPAGVAARDVGECLRLQLDAVDPALRAAAREIVAQHIDRLAQRDSPTIAQRLGRTLREVDAACTALRRLDPRPGWRFAHGDTRYVAPDVVARKVRGRWEAQLNAALVPQVRLNRTCAELFRQHRDANHGALGAHLQEARWTMRNIEQRFSTILSVAQAIVRRQQLFFEHGALAMKPLALKDIAEEVGIHESTVCRVTNNKYIATPGGLLELKQFFSRAMPMSTGGACSATAIRGVVKELIDAEDARAPLSDVDITERLARQGLTVARRTVTKYRQALKIAPAERRRVHMDAEAPAEASGAGEAPVAMDTTVAAQGVRRAVAAGGSDAAASH